MKVILFGATGMVGQGVLRECLLDPDVETVLAIGRSATGQKQEKLREIALQELTEFSAIEENLSGYDACFFCLGVTSAGRNEDQYRRVTYDITIAAARTLARLNPRMTFIYISGMGADSSERGRVMWARVRGQTENEVLKLPFQGYVIRPAYIQPMHGIRSKTKWYQAFYNVVAPVYPLLKAIAPGYVTTTEELGRAMIRIAAQGSPKRVVESRDIRKIH